jgi:hypothetical protein
LDLKGSYPTNAEAATEDWLPNSSWETGLKQLVWVP